MQEKYVSKQDLFNFSLSLNTIDLLELSKIQIFAPVAANTLDTLASRSERPKNALGNRPDLDFSAP